MFTHRIVMALLIAFTFPAVAQQRVWTAPGGHFKFPHPWPGQNPPLDNGGSGECLRGVSALGNTSGGFLQSPALAVELQQMAVMHQPVQ